jgi:hypothetical protein
VQEDTLSGLCGKAKCSPLIGTIETTLLGSAAAAQALAERNEQDADGDVDGDDSAGAGNGGDASPVPAGKEELDSAAVLRFVNEWLSAVADATVGLLLGQIAQVPELSMVGSAQLLTDLEYLRQASLLFTQVTPQCKELFSRCGDCLVSCSNVINATGIRPHPLLAHVRLILQQDPAALLRSIDLLPGNFPLLIRPQPFMRSRLNASAVCRGVAISRRQDQGGGGLSAQVRSHSHCGDIQRLR